MNHLYRNRRHGIAAAAALALALAALPLIAEPPPAKPPVKPPAAAKPPTEAEIAAAAAYDKTVTAYLTNDFAGIETNLKAATAQMAKLTQDQRNNLEYMRKSAQEQRPKWWASTKSSTNTSFMSSIWNKPITTNFAPTDDTIGVQQALGVKDGKVVVVVSWRPSNVDNPRAADGWLAKTLGVNKGDIGECVVWHELGHLFITSQQSPEVVYELYTKFDLLYGHLQEFYADLTALYHASPKARRLVMVLRTDSIDPPYGKYRELEPHTRGSHAIGAMFLAEVLTAPAKWPNVHLPPAVPEGDVEIKTIVYINEHFTKDWSFAEDKALRDWALKTVKTQGDQIFRSKGMIALPDKNTFSLMEPQDREFQTKRNAWITEKLKKAIADGIADKPEKDPPKAGKKTGYTIVNGRLVHDEERIEIADH